MATKLLLIEDVDSLGHSGEIVSVRPGFARNFLLPQGLAIAADKRTLRMQERLREERKKKSLIDRQESEQMAAQFEGIVLTQIVKVDPEGRMYGSVSSLDIVHLLKDQAKVELDRKNIQLKHAIKDTGVHSIPVKLKEGVSTSFTLKVLSEEAFRASQEEASS